MRVRQGMRGLIVADEGHLNGLLVADGAGRRLGGYRGYGDAGGALQKMADTLDLHGAPGVVTLLSTAVITHVLWKQKWKKSAYAVGGLTALGLLSMLGSSSASAAAPSGTTTVVTPTSTAAEET